MPAEPSVAVSAKIKCDQSDIQLSGVGYKRNITAVLVVDNSDVRLSGVAFKRNIKSVIKADKSIAEINFNVKRAIYTLVRLGQSVVELRPSIKRSISASLDIGSSLVNLVPAFKRAIASTARIGQSLAEMKLSVKQSVAASLTVDQSDTTLTKLSRKILYPPPTAEITVLTAERDIPLQSAMLNIGDTYGWNIYLRGYHLDALQSGAGAYLLLSVKRNISDPDSNILFQKSTKQPISGIAFKGEIKNVQATALGTIQSAELQVRIYPFDTNRNLTSDTTLYAELELIDPLGEIVTILRKSFTMVTGVRYAAI